MRYRLAIKTVEIKSVISLEGAWGSGYIVLQQKLDFTS